MSVNLKLFGYKRGRVKVLCLNFSKYTSLFLGNTKNNCILRRILKDQKENSEKSQKKKGEG